MNKSQFIARGGVLTAVSVLLLYLSCMLPMIRISLCAAGGVVLAMPLSRRRVKLGMTIYAATSILAILILPQKSVAFAYAWVFGLYTLVKYGIEKLHRFSAQWVCKLLFATVNGGLILVLLQKGVVAEVALTNSMPGFLLGGIWYLFFAAYDVAFSKLMAQLRRMFPMD